MSVRPSARRAVALTFTALLAASLGYAGGASAGTTETTSYSSDCSAQLLALSLGGNAVPLDAGRTCAKPGDSFFPVGTIAGPAQFPFLVDVLYEHTAKAADGSSAEARAGVAHVFLPLSAFGGPDLTVDVLTARSACADGRATGESHVVGVQAGDNGAELPADITGNHLDLGPLGYVDLNGTESSSTSSDTGEASNPRVQTATQRRSDTALHVVLLPGKAPGGAAVVDLAVARTSVSCSRTTTTTTTTPPNPSGQAGWMTGGGQTGTTAVQHAFVLPCTLSQQHPGPHLSLQVPGAGAFRLTALTSVSCSTVAGNGDPEQPDAGFNTLQGKGVGDCNGRHGVDVSFTFTDGGEPNKGRDKDAITTDENNRYGCHVAVAGPTTNGNQQAHRGNHPPA